MAFEVTPFCWIVKFSGITRFLYQFWKILPKYCGRKEKDHNILWSKWYSRWESNPERPLRRGLLYPFNYGSVLNFIARGRNHCRKKFYTKIYTSFFPPRENKHKSSGFARKTCVLGNILWIEQYLRRGLLYPFNYGSISCYPAGNNSSLRSSCHRKRWGEPEMIFPASMQKHILLSRLGILRRCAPRATASGGPFKRRRSPQNREPFERPLFYNVSRKKATVFEGEV